MKELNMMLGKHEGALPRGVYVKLQVAHETLGAERARLDGRDGVGELAQPLGGAWETQRNGERVEREIHCKAWSRDPISRRRPCRLSPGDYAGDERWRTRAKFSGGTGTYNWNPPAQRWNPTCGAMAADFL